MRLLTLTCPGKVNRRAAFPVSPGGTLTVVINGKRESLISGQMINTSHRRVWLTFMDSLSSAKKIVSESEIMTKQRHTGGSEKERERSGERCVLGGKVSIRRALSLINLLLRGMRM